VDVKGTTVQFAARVSMRELLRKRTMGRKMGIKEEEMVSSQYME